MIPAAGLMPLASSDTCTHVYIPVQSYARVHIILKKKSPEALFKVQVLRLLLYWRAPSFSLSGISPSPSHSVQLRPQSSCLSLLSSGIIYSMCPDGLDLLFVLGWRGWIRGRSLHSDRLTGF